MRERFKGLVLLDTLDVGEERAPIGATMAGQFHHHARKQRDNGRGQVCGRGKLVVKPGLEDFARGEVGEGFETRGKKVKCGAEAVNVGAAIKAAGVYDFLGRKIIGGAEDVRAVIAGIWRAGAEGVVERGDVRMLAVVETNVAGVDVPEHETVFAPEAGKGMRENAGELQELLRRERAFLFDP